MVSLRTTLGLLRGLDGFIGKTRLAMLKKVMQTRKEMLRVFHIFSGIPSARPTQGLFSY